MQLSAEHTRQSSAAEHHRLTPPSYLLPLPCCRHAGIKGNGGRLTSPDQLPEVLPMAACGERFPIPPDDPRSALAADVGAQWV